MSKSANPTLIGAFTLTGLAIGALVIVLFGAGKFLTPTHDVLLYFQKSAYGLQVGSDVRFGGVRIGSVKSMSVLVDQLANRKIIPVVVELGDKELRRITTSENSGFNFSTFEGVQHAVSRGLRAGMKQQSLVTGQLYVEFDIVPNTPGFTYSDGSPPPCPVVPTIDTEMDELFADIADAVHNINSLDLAGALQDLRTVLDTANNRLAEFNTKSINANLIELTTNLNDATQKQKLTTTLDHLDQAILGLDTLTRDTHAGIKPVLSQMEKTLTDATAAIQRIDTAAREIATFANPRSPTQLRLQQVLQETDRTARALQELTTDLKNHPQAILSGKSTPTP